MITEEGDVIVQKIDGDKSEAPDGMYGPLAQWVLGGMDMGGPMKKLGLDEKDLGLRTEDLGQEQSTVPSPKSPTSAKATAGRQVLSPPPVSIHTITLPDRAPKQLLLELKSLFEAHPGSEKVQLKIGGQVIPVPFMVRVSPALDSAVEEVIGRFAVRT